MTIKRKPLNTLAPGIYEGAVVSVSPVGPDVVMCFEIEGKQYFQTLRPNVPNTHRRTPKVVPSVPATQSEPPVSPSLAAIVSEAWHNAKDNGHDFNTWTDEAVATDMQNLIEELENWNLQSIINAVKAHRRTLK